MGPEDINPDQPEMMEEPEEARPGKGSAKSPGLVRRLWPYAAIVLGLTLIMVQALGILLRDKLEGRFPSTPPVQVLKFLDENAPRARESHEEAGRGFGVVEVPVGLAAGEPETHAPAPETAHGTPAAAEKPHAAAAEEAVHAAPAARPAEEAKPAPEVKPPTKEALPKTPAKEKFKADPKGGYAITVGAFNSKKLVNAMEARLDGLGFPHFRSVVIKEADGYLLTLSSDKKAALDAAEKSLADSELRYKRTGSKIETRFISEDEAKETGARIAKSGVAADIRKSFGQLPLWRIMVGPGALPVLEKAREKLKAEGLDAVIVRHQK